MMLSSCGTVRYNKIYSYDDEFRGSSRKYLRVEMKDNDRRNEIGHARVLLESSLNGNDHQMVAYFVIPRTTNSFKADGSGFMKAGEEKFEIPIVDPVSELKIKNGDFLSAVTSIDSTGVSSIATAMSDTEEWIEDKFMLNLTEDHLRSMVPAEEVVFRFYFGPVPVTYVLRGKKLALIKTVLQ